MADAYQLVQYLSEVASGQFIKKNTESNKYIQQIQSESDATNNKITIKAIPGTLTYTPSSDTQAATLTSTQEGLVSSDSVSAIEDYIDDSFYSLASSVTDGYVTIQQENGVLSSVSLTTAGEYDTSSNEFASDGLVTDSDVVTVLNDFWTDF